MLARKHGKKTDAEVLDFFLSLFLQGDVPSDSLSRLREYMQRSTKQATPIYWTADDVADQRVRTLCNLVLRLPEYQLE